MPEEMKRAFVVMNHHWLFPNPVQGKHFGWIMNKVAGS